MNKEETAKITSFLNEAERLPDELLTEREFNDYMANEESESYVIDKLSKQFEYVGELKLRLFGYFRALGEDHIAYVAGLEEITFRPKNIQYNIGHFRNSEAWRTDKTKLINLLKMARVEFQEKERMGKGNPENSYLAFLKTNEFKGIILTAVIGIVVTLGTYFLGKLFADNNFSKDSQKSEVNNLISEDRTLVLDKSAHEVFINYYNTVRSLRKEYTSITCERYIEQYLEAEVKNIEMRIKNRSYVHRFAKNENVWMLNDYKEIEELLQARTIGRMKEISQDVKNSTQGPFTLSEDRLKALEERLVKEIDL